MGFPVWHVISVDGSPASQPFAMQRRSLAITNLRCWKSVGKS